MHVTNVAFARPAFWQIPAPPRFTLADSPVLQGGAYAEEALPVREPGGFSHKAILVVEDDVTVRTLVHRILVKAGYRVDTAVNGEDGWEKLNERPYDLLITDHEMPLLTGLNLIERVRRNGYALPIILMSGAIVTGSLSSEGLNRPDVFLSKPFSLPALVSEVDSQLIAA